MALQFTGLNHHTEVTFIPAQYMKRDILGPQCMLTEGLNAVITVVTCCLFGGFVRQVGPVMAIT